MADSAAILEAIRDMLIGGKFAPGTPLRQEALANELGVSRVPVRESLRTLQAVGLVDWVPNVGFSATRLTFREFEEIVRIRDMLETDAIEQTFRHGLSQKTISLMEAAHGSEKCLTVEELAQVRQVNRRFHFALFESSRHQFALIRQLWDIVDPYRAFYYSTDAHLKTAVHEHEGILDAVRARDVELTVELSRAHRRWGIKQLAMILD